MIQRLLTGTPIEFKYRIPLSFYPLIGLCAYAAAFPPSLQVSFVCKIAAGLVFFSGLILRIWGSSFLTSDVVVDARARDDFLVTDGPFALIRHPLYSGAGLMLSALVAFLPLPLVIPFFVYASAVGLRLAFFEEKLMTEKFGARYAEYLARTGRHAPNLLKLPRTRWRDVARVGSLRGAVLSEFIFVAYSVFLLAGLVTENARLLYGGIVITSVVCGFIVKKFARHAKV